MSASGELLRVLFQLLLQLLVLQLGGLKEHDNVCKGKNYPLLLGHMAWLQGFISFTGTR